METDAMLIDSMGETLAEMDEEEAEEGANKFNLVHTIKSWVLRATADTELEFISVADRNETIRILRKSSDFRSDNDLCVLRRMFGHIDFPARVRIPGINPHEEVNELLRRMSYRLIRSGSYVYSAGDYAEEVYIVIQGEVDVDTVNTLKHEPAGGADVQATPGCMFGEDAGTTAALKKREGMAIANTQLHLAALSRSDISRFYRNCVKYHAEEMRKRFEIEATGHLRGFFSGWEFIKEVDQVRVYQKNTGTICSFKGIGFVNKPVNEVANFIFDHKNRFDWDPLYMGGKVIERIDGWTVVRQDAVYTPSPLHLNRDFLSLYCIHMDHELGEHYGISRSIQNVHIKERKDMVRAEQFDTGFRVIEDPENKDQCIVTFISQVNPKGNYPGWLTDRVNMQQASFISNIRKAMSRILVTDKLKICLLEAGMIFNIQTAFTGQNLDMWCFDHDNLNEVMDMSKTRRNTKKIYPVPGDHLYTNFGNKILTVVEDTFEHQIDFMNKSYSYQAYHDSECEDEHMECSDDLRDRLVNYGLSPPVVPLPWSLFTEVNVSGRDYFCVPSGASSGQSLKVKALRNVVVCVSSCSCSEHPKEKLHESNIHIGSRLSHYSGFSLAEERDNGETDAEYIFK